MTDTLADLQRVRAQHYDNMAVFWALTVAIDLVLGAPYEDDLKYLVAKSKETANV